VNEKELENRTSVAREEKSRESLGLYRPFKRNLDQTVSLDTFGMGEVPSSVKGVKVVDRVEGDVDTSTNPGKTCDQYLMDRAGATLKFALPRITRSDHQ